MNFKDKTIVYLEINEEDMLSGMDALSFVSKPATLIEWQKFNNQLSEEELRKEFFKSDNSKRVVTGPIMLAETAIKRFSPIIGEYFVKFSADTIFSMMKKYFKDGKINRVNEQHNSKKVVKNVYLIESFIIGDKVESKTFNDLPEGTWMGSYYIEDEQYWNDSIINGDFTGFSLEGFFIEKYEDDMIDQMYSEIETILDSNFSEEEKQIKIKKVLNLV